MSPVSRYLPPPCIVSYSWYPLGNVHNAAGDSIANVGPGNVVYLLENESSFAILTPPLYCVLFSVSSRKHQLRRRRSRSQGRSWKRCLFVRECVQFRDTYPPPCIVSYSRYLLGKHQLRRRRSRSQGGSWKWCLLKKYLTWGLSQALIKYGSR